MAGEAVEFELEQGPQSLVAKNLKRSETRLTGEVVEFEKGKGLVECHQDGKQYSIYFRDFVGTDGIPLCKKDVRVKCESGEELEFYVTNDDRFGEKAIQIIMVDSRKPLEKFAYLPNFEQHLQRLASLSDESWDYQPLVRNEGFPVLKNYLMYTFSRLKREEKQTEVSKINYATTTVSWNGEERQVANACINTGLADKYQQDIFAYFEENLNKKYCKDPGWVLKGFFPANKGPMALFAVKPEAANYLQDLDSLCDLLFDPDRKLTLCYDHLLEERDSRFPENLRSKSISEAGIIAQLDLAVQKAVKRVRRNYKAAVPQYFNHKIQLLLPLCLESDDVVDLALVVEKKGNEYFASAVLDLEKAYSNARLIAKPDREWLIPSHLGRSVKWPEPKESAMELQSENPSQGMFQ